MSFKGQSQGTCIWRILSWRFWGLNFVVEQKWHDKVSSRNIIYTHTHRGLVLHRFLKRTRYDICDISPYSTESFYYCMGSIILVCLFRISLLDRLSILYSKTKCKFTARSFSFFHHTEDCHQITVFRCLNSSF